MKILSFGKLWSCIVIAAVAYLDPTTLLNLANGRSVEWWVLLAVLVSPLSLCGGLIIMLSEPKKICEHCGYPIEIRNPSGFCDHLYYPEYCPVCENWGKGRKEVVP